MALYQPTYRSGGIQAPRLPINEVGAIGQAFADVAQRNDERRRLDLAEKRQAEQDAMRKAEYDMRMGEAQRGIDQRDLLNEVGRESMQQMQPHLLAQNEPLLNKLSTGTVEGWKQAEQRASEKDSRIAEALKQRDAGNLTAEQYEPIRQEILRSTVDGGSTVQAAAVAPFSSYSPIREDADAFVRNRLLNAGVDIDKAGAFAQQATTGLTDRATYQAQGEAARDAAIEAEKEQYDRNLKKFEIAQKTLAEQGKLEGRAISSGLSIDDDGNITGVYKSGSNKGSPFAISAKDITVHDVLESYDDYKGFDSGAKNRVRATLESEEFRGLPENVKAAAVKHAVEDATLWYGDNRVDVNEGNLLRTLRNYKDSYSKTGSAPSIENSVIKGSRARTADFLDALGGLGTGGKIPLARSAEQMRDAGPEARLQAFLGMTAPEGVEEPTVSARELSTVQTAPRNQQTPETATARPNPVETVQNARLERGDVGVDLASEFLQRQGLPSRESVISDYQDAMALGDEVGVAQGERALHRIDQALREESANAAEAGSRIPRNTREQEATKTVNAEFDRLRAMYPSADPDVLYNSVVDATLGNAWVNTGESQVSAPDVVTNRLGRTLLGVPAALTLGGKGIAEGLGVVGESIANRVPLSVVMQDSEAPARLRAWLDNYRDQTDPYRKIRESMYR